ncbi:MAG: ABC transporter permease [Peptoniphilaceae bacterium]|uniref:ABC transporter permease n=1 Tax=Parvimonas sp. TaxID=1944660 RepID=UPI0025D1AB44|nr:ABC transporter permease [Parvimonas sp.]MCI5998033.1 ABC transporter permease [Parvimonas sp.]MDD7764967.1 ABC transporter permease [Peptoniphilaceae bacterium]MDY3050349.1 ABC transporter permease [Parvimonas sp.]
MFWRMVFGTVIRQRKKMFMIAFTIALGVSLATAMLNVMLGVGDKVNKELKTYGANINVVSKDASLISDLYEIENNDKATSDKYLKEEDLPKIKQIFWGFSIVDFTPYLQKNVSVNNQKTKLIGTWFNKHMDLTTGETIDTGMKNLKNWWKITGQWLDEKDDNFVMVGSLFAGRNNIKVGDSVDIKYNNISKSYKVKGIFESGGDEDLNVFSTLSSSQQLFGVEGKISNIEVSALTTPDNELAKKATRDPNSLTPSEYETWYCTAYVSSICYQIQEVVQDSVAKPIRQVAESEGKILDKTKLLMILITALSSIGSALGISNLVTATVMEKSQEIGLIKAVGGSNIRITLLILTEIIITGIIGGILGYFIGLAFTQIIGVTVFKSYIEPAIMVIPIDIALVFGVSIIGSIPAINYLFKLKPTEVLHGR